MNVEFEKFYGYYFKISFVSNVKFTILPESNLSNCFVATLIRIFLYIKPR